MYNQRGSLHLDAQASVILSSDGLFELHIVVGSRQSMTVDQGVLRMFFAYRRLMPGDGHGHLSSVVSRMNSAKTCSTKLQTCKLSGFCGTFYQLIYMLYFPPSIVRLQLSQE